MPEQLENIEFILDKIHQNFKEHFFYMDFFFCYKNKKVRTIFNVIRSLPNLLLRTEDEIHPSVTFESTWTNVNLHTPLVREMSPQGFPLRRGERPKNYFAHSYMGIPLVSQINVFDWGFEILSEAGIDMIGIVSQKLTDTSIGYLQSLVGQTVWAVPPLREGTDQEVKYYWRKTLTDDFDNFIFNKQHGAAMAQAPVQMNSKKIMVIEDEV